jgi:cyanate lyase
VGHVEPRQVMSIEDVALHVALGVADADAVGEGNGQDGGDDTGRRCDTSLLMMTRQEVTDLVQAAMRQRGVTFAQLAEELERPPVWVAAAALGQHPFTHAEAEKLAARLALPKEAVAVLEQIPMRGSLGTPVPVDATIYRLYEVIQVYGPALKALIHEEFGDGIMSAINFRADVERVPDPAGDRVRITLDGKFLPYQWG